MAYKITSIESFIGCIEEVEFFQSLLRGESDGGFHLLMQDFKQYVSKAVIEQFHGGVLSPQNKSTHKEVMQKVCEYVLRRLHTSLFREPSQ